MKEIEIISEVFFKKMFSKLMMMMIVRRRRLRWKIKEKKSNKGTPTPGIDATIGHYRSGLWDARNRRKYEPMCGIPLHKKGRGDYAQIISSRDRNDTKDT